MTSQEQAEFRIMLSELRQFRDEVNTRFGEVSRQLEDLSTRIGTAENRLHSHLDTSTDETKTNSIQAAINFDFKKVGIAGLLAGALALFGAGVRLLSGN